MPNEIPIVMPKMSMTMESGELLVWIAHEGDVVSAGDVIAEVQTDKVDMEVESPADGTLLRTVANVGDTVAVGQPLAYLVTESESLLGALLEHPDGGTIPDADPHVPSSQPAGAGSVNGGKMAATPPSRRGPVPAVPQARRRAAQLGVRLSTVSASGPGGVITVADVEAATQSKTDRVTSRRPETSHETAVAAESVPNSADADPGFASTLDARRRSVRAAVARTLTHSATIPQFTTFADIDLEIIQGRRAGVGWTTLLVRALALALSEHPTVLAGWDEATAAPRSAPPDCNVAIAVDTPIGLLAPVVRQADRQPLGAVEKTVRDLISRARAGRLSLSDMQGAHTTVSNLGGFAVPAFTSLITPPQASALSVGAIAPRPVVVNGGLAVRLGVTIGLTVDHRAVDGADAARVLQSITARFAQPEQLLD